MIIRLDEWRRRRSRLAARYPSGARGPRPRGGRYSRAALGYGLPVAAIAFFLALAAAPEDWWPRAAPGPDALSGKPGQVIEGRARIVDGDTFAIRGNIIRLLGIDAFELRQTCEGIRLSYPCGREAARALERIIAGEPVTCRAFGSDRYRRILATCTANGRDLGGAMVSAGWALAGPDGLAAYSALERDARAQRRGAWQGTFQHPAEWRRARHEQTRY